MKKQRGTGLVIGGVVLVILVALAIVAAIYKDWLRDYFVGRQYEPTVTMVAIRGRLSLTGRGEFVFNAVQPELNERGDFNRNCRTEVLEDAVLGCYANGKIYVYNIVNEELVGIRELATAHELLHAVYTRLSESEHKELEPILRAAYADNLATLQEEVENYAEDAQLEEIYVRLGTEVKNLPEKLERHFAEVFESQDEIVNYYDSYIAVFREIETQLAELSDKLQNKKTDLDDKTAEYERRVAQFNADVVSFNACAAVVGCIKSEWEFSVRRGELIQEQEALGEMHLELENLVSDYNALVAEYNATVVHGQTLGDAINSTVVPEGME